MSRHRCFPLAENHCPHVFVWRDLLPIESYRNGNDGRHHRADDGVMCFCPACGEPTRAHATNCDHCGYSATTTTKES